VQMQDRIYIKNSYPAIAVLNVWPMDVL